MRIFLGGWGCSALIPIFIFLNIQHSQDIRRLHAQLLYSYSAGFSSVGKLTMGFYLPPSPPPQNAVSKNGVIDVPKIT